MDNQQPSPTRKCKICGAELPLDEFPIYGHNGSRRHACKVCYNEYQERWRSGNIVPVNRGAPERTCKICGEIKPLEDFAMVYSERNRGRNYRQHKCSDCERDRHAAYMREARKKAPERYREHQKSHRQKNYQTCLRQQRESARRLKNEVFEVYGGYRCVCCGETHPSMLTLDHINEDGNLHRAALSGRVRGTVDMYRKLRDAGYPSDIQVLCYNCNISKHRNGGICAHRRGEGSEAIPKGSTR